MNQATTSTPRASTQVDILDPDRIAGKHFELVHREDHKLCPKAVQRCEQCRVGFNMADKVVIKSVGVRERTDKSGKIVKYSGNVYLHYLTSCLREYDQNFSFHAITVPSRTLKYLPRGSRETLLAKSLQVEPEESDHL